MEQNKKTKREFELYAAYDREFKRQLQTIKRDLFCSPMLAATELAVASINRERQKSRCEELRRFP